MNLKEVFWTAFGLLLVAVVMFIIPFFLPEFLYARDWNMFGFGAAYVVMSFVIYFVFFFVVSISDKKSNVDGTLIIIVVCTVVTAIFLALSVGSRYESILVKISHVVIDGREVDLETPRTVEVVLPESALQKAGRKQLQENKK